MKNKRESASVVTRVGVPWIALLGRFICDVCKDIFPPLKDWPAIIGLSVVGTIIISAFVAPVAWLFMWLVKPEPEDRGGAYIAAICFWMLVIGGIDAVKYLRQKWMDIFLPNTSVTYESEAQP